MYYKLKCRLTQLAAMSMLTYHEYINDTVLKTMDTMAINQGLSIIPEKIVIDAIVKIHGDVIGDTTE